MRRLFKLLAPLGLLVGLVGGTAAAHAAPAAGDRPDAWSPNEDDRWLFDLRVGTMRLGDGIRAYQTPQGICGDLGDVVLGMDLAVRVDKKLRRATGWVFDERRPLTIDRDAGRVEVGSRSYKLDATTIRDTAEGWCVRLDALSEWIGVPLEADLSNALIHIRSKEKLPFQLAAERRARAAGIRPQAKFDLASLPQATRPYQTWQTPSIDVTASVTAVSDKRSGTSIARQYELFAAGEVLKHSFDARLSSDDRGLPDSLRLRLYRSDPAGQLLGPAKATHYALGDVNLVSTGLVAQSAAGRGALITNRPLERPDSFDRTDFRGDLPAGWDAELYRNGQLLGFATPDAAGRYEFLDVPLHYGTNRFEIVLYGPQGQIRREIKQMQVGIDSIPPQQTWYWAGIAQENADLISLTRDPRRFRRGWRGSIGIERGLDARTSIAAYGHSLMIEDVRRNYGEVALRRAIGPSLLEVAGSIASDGGMAARLNWLGAFGDTYVRAEAMRGWNGFVSDRMIRDVNGIYALSIDQSLNLGRTVLPIHLESRYVTRQSGIASLEAAARVSASFRAVTFTGQLDWTRTKTPGGPDPPDAMTASLLANARVGGVRLRGEAAFNLSGRRASNRFGLVGEWGDADRGEWRAELGYDQGLRRFRVGAGHSRTFRKVQLSAFGEVASDGSVAASLGLGFSFGPRSDGGWRMASDKLASRGQVEAVVWHDENGDGVRQSSERLAGGVALTAGTALVDAVTDDQGRALISGLEPFRALSIGIDGGSLPDPRVQPALPGVVVTPRPGVAIQIALPLVESGEIEGVMLRGGQGAIEGLALELVDAEGRVRATTLTEYDGFFLFEAIPYGRYTVRVSAASARAARVDAAFAMAASPGKAMPRIRLGTVAIASAVQRAGEDAPPPEAVAAPVAP